MQDETKGQIDYPSFNALNRPAMAFGVPLMLILLQAFLTIVFAFGAYFLIGFLGFIFTVALSGGLLMLIKFICEKDPNALNSLKRKLKAQFVFATLGKKGVVLFSTYISPQEKKRNVKQQIKQITD